MKGGYQIVDLKNVSITIDAVTPVTIPGVHEAITNANVKPILLEGIVVGGDAYPAQYIEVLPSSTSFTAHVTVVDDVYLLTVTNADVVTITTIS